MKEDYLCLPLSLVVMYTQPPAPATILTTQKKKAILWKGRKVPFRGALVLERSEITNHLVGPSEVGKMHICKVATISGSLCLSLGQVLPESIDVGRVGYENSWKEVRIPVELKNLSEVPLVAKLDSTPSVLLYLQSAHSSPSLVPSPIQSPTLNSHRRGSLPDLEKLDAKIPQPPPAPLQAKDFVVPISESKFFNLILDVSKLERTAGPFTCKASLINLYNPYNKMYVLQIFT